MDDFDDCLDTLYDKKSYSSVELILINGLKTVYTSLSFGCDKAGGEWCFDYYRRSLTNLTDFNCSKCGNVVLKKYKRLLKSFQDENSEDYKETKKQIEAMELCGALANASIKISSIVIVALASLFFIF
ncbi:hypothetical protein LY90DRAFT_709221 [Neocallimastix californiae]|uniref:Transmembrane protein n=1 Tax=Neocallimastix californiae TaxID=1754190 RepID=A0A1Y1Z8A2_9FUNG|nr:hypothetical protein LY90DRAFT_709221 [Neocallimastix californiae]|eukprot:ORY06045.1 hypothetical protein LY90DRAFT_709221 [Neocallimastix californiae]